MNALQAVGRSVFFSAESGAYRYWYNPSKEGLKLQMKRERLAAFRNSEVGRRLECYVDIFEIGGGWVEVHEREGWHLRQLHRDFGTYTSGVKMWMRALNEAHLKAVNANIYQVKVEKVPNIVPFLQVAAEQHKSMLLQQLANKFNGQRHVGRAHH